MKKIYKNKRDQYKAEAEKLKGELTRKQMTLDSVSDQFRKYKKEHEETKKGLSCEIYCTNCQTAYSAIVLYGGSVKESGCAYCGARNCGYLIAKNKTQKT